MKKENLKMIVFDMDGVLLDSEPLHEDARQLMYKRFQVVQDEKFPEPVGMSMRDFWELLAERFHIEKSGAELEQEHYRLVAQLVREQHTPPSEGLLELLEWAKANDIRLGVASSSGSELVDSAMELLGIRHYFDCIVTADDVENRKPDPEPYQRALQLCGVRPEEAAAVEDSRTGLLSAKCAGMYTFGCANPTSGNQRLELSDIQLENENGFSEEAIPFVVTVTGQKHRNQDIMVRTVRRLEGVKYLEVL